MIIIPARLASTRLANKILLPFGDVPLFVATARQVSGVDDVVVAVDDEGVLDIARKYGLKAIMTGTHHQSGTDRIYEAASIMGLGDDDLIVNVQADEPFIEPENISDFIKFCKDKNAFMYSCFKLVDEKAALDENLVKVVTSDDLKALYFSRSIIPYPRSKAEYYKAHLGIYGYTMKSLKRFCTLSVSSLEATEKLEQLRALQVGYDIYMLEIKSSSFGIDSQQDYEKALALLG